MNGDEFQDSEAAAELLQELIKGSNIKDTDKDILLNMSLRAIFDQMSHQYKEIDAGERARLFRVIAVSDIPFGPFIENLVVWLESVSVGMALVNIGEAIQENIKNFK